MGKYSQMKFQFYLNNKLYDDRENDTKNGLPTYTMRYSNSSIKTDNNVFDISQYMKKTR